MDSLPLQEKMYNRTMAAVSDLWLEWMFSTSSRARRVLVLNFLENRRRSPARAMRKAANRQSLSQWEGGGGQVRSRASPREISGSQSGTEPGFSPSTSVFPCMQQSTKHRTQLHLQVTIPEGQSGCTVKSTFVSFFISLIQLRKSVGTTTE